MTIADASTPARGATEVSPVEVFARLSVADPGCGDRDGVVGVVEDCRRIRAFVDAVEVGCTRRLRELAAEGSSESPESILNSAGRRSRRDAARAKGRELVTAAMHGFAAALADGSISAGHLDAIADATRNLDAPVRDEFNSHQTDLLHAAGGQGVDDFEQGCRDLARLLVRIADADAEVDELERLRKLSKIRRSVDRDSGMRRTIIELDPIRDEMLHRVLKAHLRRVRHSEPNTGRPFNELEIDAVMSMVTAAGRSTATVATMSAVDGDTGHAVTDPVEPVGVAPVPEIGILISLEWLLDQAAEHGICETYDGTPVPVSTVRRLCCDADIIAYVLGADGAVVDMGRSTRTVTRDQRRRLRAMHRTCAGRDCPVPFEDCRIHHVRFWTRDTGPTDIDNLLPLCERCHHQVHEGHWTLTMTPDRVATWTRPDGTTFHTGTTINRTKPVHTERTVRTSRGRPPPDKAA